MSRELDATVANQPTTLAAAPSPNLSETALEASAMECVLTNEQLEEKLAYWQKVLKLQDWDVKVRIVRASQMELEGCGGENRWEIQTKTALISLCDHLDWPSGPWEQDMEETLVHELLHLHMAPFQPEHGTLEQVMMEQAICSIAEGMVALHRKASGTQGEGGRA